ncbi:hypothetical protein MPNT_80061 [Candidatus Methylacidithermus pantelleriae]|uniref:Uncharacterized protein n=1 Tax=Candidatus Methylacidithermus pantelleriae TaxID=2744239 RepID=A0A8J2BM59_9BACT|nr:hypothetical protein MPNT_80061 [Candidatus Methylacidithermus pantelleriae]
MFGLPQEKPPVPVVSTTPNLAYALAGKLTTTRDSNLKTRWRMESRGVARCDSPEP